VIFTHRFFGRAHKKAFHQRSLALSFWELPFKEHDAIVKIVSLRTDS